MDYKSIIRWLLVPIVSVVTAYTALMTATMLLANALYPYSSILLGVIVALVFVVSGALVAPRHNVTVAVILFLVGIMLSWQELSTLTKADVVTPINITMGFTYVSGIVGILTIYLIKRKRNGN